MFRSSFVFAISFILASAIALPALAYVSPGAPTGYVNDFAGVLSDSAKTDLETTLTQFHDETGGDIAVAVVQSLGGDDIESYSNTLFRQWGVGNKDNDTGILMVVAVEDRQVRIEVGYGYEGIVPDAYASRIINDVITPRFKDGDYDGGITDGVAALIAYIKDPNAAAPIQEESDNNTLTLPGIGALGYFFFFLVTWLGSVLGRSKSWWAGGIVGGGVSVVLFFIFGLTIALFSALPLIGLGLLFDYFVSKTYNSARASGRIPPWWIGGGGFGGGGGGGFGGFGGGSSGGGGASGRW